MYSLVEARPSSWEIFPARPLNFFGRIRSLSPRSFLQKTAAERLDRGQKKLKKRAGRLNLFDGDRPGSVQKIIWSVGPDPDFVVDPRVGWTHKRPAALEATPIGSGRVGRLQDIGREGL